jgi:excisionase family DNA binding protein
MKTYLTTTQAGGRLGVPNSTVRRMIGRGELPAVRSQGDGAYIFAIRDEDVDKLAAKRGKASKLAGTSASF